MFHFTGYGENSHQERWSILLQFCCKFTKVSVCQKLWKYYEVWQNYCKNNKGAIFLPHSVEMKKITLLKQFIKPSGSAKTLCLFHSSTRVLSLAVDIIPRPPLLLYDMQCRIFIASNLTEVLVLFASLQNIVILSIIFQCQKHKCCMST